jgi:hypothetical protein
MKYLKSGLTIVKTCPGCKQQFDPDVCWCGTEINSHSYEEHPFVPYGCECLMSKRKKSLFDMPLETDLKDDQF